MLMLDPCQQQSKLWRSCTGDTELLLSVLITGPALLAVLLFTGFGIIGSCDNASLTITVIWFSIKYLSFHFTVHPVA